MSKARTETARRVLVTGSRGKSSIVRLLHVAFHNCGLQSYARITGVLPRELNPHGIRVISRSAGAHVEEMRWWLRGLPGSAQAIVMENSAISPDFQGLAVRWLKPELTVLSNSLPDHQELWGPGKTNAAEVLTGGIPKGGQVILPASLKGGNHLLGLLEDRNCHIRFAEPVPGPKEAFQAINLGLALAVVDHLGLQKGRAMQAMLDLRPDIFDFNVIKCRDAELAMAFSVNDINSTKTLFQSLSWAMDETRLVYNHRADRPGRLESFVSWLNNTSWREVLIIGDKPRVRLDSARYLCLRNEKGLLGLFNPGDRIFGCGNITGIPLALADGMGQYSGINRHGLEGIFE